MKYPFYKPLIWLAALFLAVSLACGAPTPAPTEAPPPAQPAQPVETEPVQPAASGAVSTLQDVKGAVIQIEAQGAFVDPEIGEYVGAGRGSGFIIDPSGLAVTNNHVVTGAALLKVWIGGDTSKTYNAVVLGVSECSDLAVIDIDGEGFPYLEWYASPVTVGLEVYLAGFPLGETEYSLTKGIVSKESASGETDWSSIESVIVHDATGNPGNSGGPLITTDGKVVGVHYRSRPNANQYFAIGRDAAVPILDELKTGKDVDSIGVNGVAVMSEDGSISGIWVSSVEAGSPADKTGITGGDVLLSLGDHPLATDGTMSDYCDIIRTHQPADTVDVEVLRFDTSEVLAGQLNGETLAQAYTFGETDTSTGDVAGDTTGGTAEEPPAFYLEEFEADELANWHWFTTSGDENLFNIHTEAGKLIFDLEGVDLYTYLVYDPWIYERVVIETSAENRGKNTNNVGLICHAGDYGWYEFSISNGGEWWIWAYDATTDQYDMLASGGSTAVRMGKDINQYAAVCDSNTLSLYINGVHTHTLTEKSYVFREGQVGIGVSSFNVLPIILEFDWINIYEP
ncbi:MAG: PDZ domain-containing protein [Chloroflexi bacterium]|nr:PDZ domain-containing protein [Chloroflexota bacterium]